MIIRVRGAIFRRRVRSGAKGTHTHKQIRERSRPAGHVFQNELFGDQSSVVSHIAVYPLNRAFTRSHFLDVLESGVSVDYPIFVQAFQRVQSTMDMDE